MVVYGLVITVVFKGLQIAAVSSRGQDQERGLRKRTCFTLRTSGAV